MSYLTRCKFLSVIKVAEGPQEKPQWPPAHCDKTSITYVFLSSLSLSAHEAYKKAFSITYLCHLKVNVNYFFTDGLNIK